LPQRRQRASIGNERDGIAMIEVKKINASDPVEFEVVVRQGQGESRDRVTLARQTLEKLAPGESAENCVEAAFRFLLDRERKESILKRFDIAVIPSYFPEFPHDLPRYLVKP
jgi:hypothetical protein